MSMNGSELSLKKYKGLTIYIKEKAIYSPEQDIRTPLGNFNGTKFKFQYNPANKHVKNKSTYEMKDPDWINSNSKCVTYKEEKNRHGLLEFCLVDVEEENNQMKFANYFLHLKDISNTEDNDQEKDPSYSSETKDLIPHLENIDSRTQDFAENTISIETVRTLPPIVAREDLVPGKLILSYPIYLLTCPDTLPFICRTREKFECSAVNKLNFEYKGFCKDALYLIDEMLFYLLQVLNNTIMEEEIKQNKVKGEYIVLVTQYKDEPYSTRYCRVSKLDFEVSELMKKDAILNMKRKKEPIQVNSHMKIISIEWKGPAWIDRHCGKCTIVLFFLIIFFQSYVYEKIKKCIRNDVDENDDGNENNDDEEIDDDDDDETDGEDDGIKNDGKTEVVASEV